MLSAGLLKASAPANPLLAMSTHSEATIVHSASVSLGERNQLYRMAVDITDASKREFMESTTATKPYTIGVTLADETSFAAAQTSKIAAAAPIEYPGSADHPAASKAELALLHFDAAAYLRQLRANGDARKAAARLDAAASSAAQARLRELARVATQNDPVLTDFVHAEQLVPGAVQTGNGLGSTLLHCAAVTSTMALMTDSPLRTALPPGAVFLADVQRNGRGRAGNSWLSSAGCLMVNVSLPVTSGRLLPFVQYLIGWAIVTAVRMHPEGAALSTGIKWPNDIYINGRKAGGIICQSSTITANPLCLGGAGSTQPAPARAEPAFLVHAGFGVNVAGAGVGGFPSLNSELAALRAGAAGLPPLEEAADDGDAAAAEKAADVVSPAAVSAAKTAAAATTAATEATSPAPGWPAVVRFAPRTSAAVYAKRGAVFAREDILANIVSLLDEALPVFNAVGFGPFLADYLDFWLHSGQIVSVEGKEGTFTVTGISQSGYLCATSVATGETWELHPDGNSFDMAQSFIAVKRTGVSTSAQQQQQRQQ